MLARRWENAIARTARRSDSRRGHAQSGRLDLDRQANGRAAGDGRMEGAKNNVGARLFSDPAIVAATLVSGSRKCLAAVSNSHV